MVEHFRYSIEPLYDGRCSGTHPAQKSSNLTGDFIWVPWQVPARVGQDPLIMHRAIAHYEAAAQSTFDFSDADAGGMWEHARKQVRPESPGPERISGQGLSAAIRDNTALTELG